VQRLFSSTATSATNGNPLTLESNAATTAMVVNNGGVVTGTATVHATDPQSDRWPGYRHYSLLRKARTMSF
jgi:hypothetical protein